MSDMTPTLEPPELRLGKQPQANWLNFKQQFSDCIRHVCCHLDITVRKRSLKYMMG